MATQKSNMKDTGNSAVHKSAIRLALVVFFVATVSASAGFLQGERVALDGERNVAATSQSNIPLVFQTVQPLTTDERCRRMWNPGLLRLICNSPDEETYYPLKLNEVQELRFHPDLDGGKYFIGENCTDGGGCEFMSAPLGANSAEVKNALSEYENRPQVPLSNGLNTATFETGNGSTGGGAASKANVSGGGNNPNLASNASGSAGSALTCTEGKGEGCTNACSTSYVTIDDRSGKENVVDCYGKGQDKSKDLLETLARCIDPKLTPGQGPLDAATNSLKQELCIVENEIKLSQDGKTLSVRQGASTNTKTITIPAECKVHAERIQKIREGEGFKDNAGEGSNNVNVCAWRGGAVCFPTGLLKAEFTPVAGDSGRQFQKWVSVLNPTTSKNFTCTRKIPGLLPGDGAGGGGVQNPGGGAGSCNVLTNPRGCLSTKSGGVIDTFKKTLGQAFGLGLGQWLFQPSSESNRNNTRGGSSGSGQPGAAAPTCSLVASSENIESGQTTTLRWRSANAERVSITDIGSNVPPNEQRAVTPQVTTTYTLTAEGRGGTETCSVTINVEGDPTGPTGVAPPQLSCTPGLIEKGSSANIRWACSSRADSSAGVGIDTDGKLSGSISVSPEFNTEYAVTCRDENDVEIGRNSCVVNVGEPIFDMLVHPSSAKRGDRVRVSWASLFMDTCSVRGPRGFSYDRTQGVVITEPFALDNNIPDDQIRSAVYSLECKSEFGGVFSKDVTVDFRR